MQDPAQAWAFLEDSDRISSADEVQAAIRRVAGEINGRLADAYPLVLVVMAGAVVFAGQLLPLLHFPLDLDFVHASRYGNSTAGGTLEWRVAPPEALVRGRAVLLLDDILDGGTTLLAIRERMLQQGARRVLSAVLVEKVRARGKPASADFVGLRIPDRFVFGCGMDAKGYWRNLPELRAMKRT
jgi:hypoxanthine phosphoribosyltransferase